MARQLTITIDGEAKAATCGECRWREGQLFIYENKVRPMCSLFRQQPLNLARELAIDEEGKALRCLHCLEAEDRSAAAQPRRTCGCFVSDPPCFCDRDD